MPSLAFFHIPLPEHETARWTCREFGEKQEGVCAPSVNTGLYSSFIEKRDVIGVFVGHDHNNDYMVDLDGNITLAYGRKTGYPSAYNETLSRGVRVINLHEDESVFDTYIRDLKGTYFHYQFEQKIRAVIFLVSVVPLCKSFGSKLGQRTLESGNGYAERSWHEVLDLCTCIAGR